MIYLMTELVTGMRLFLVWCHKLLCMHIYKDWPRCKSVCDVKSGIDPRPSLVRSCDRWWLDFLPFTVYEKSKFGRTKKKLRVRIHFEFILAKKVVWNLKKDRASMGKGVIRLMAKILVILRLTVILFPSGLKGKLKINLLCLKELNINNLLFSVFQTTYFKS